MLPIVADNPTFCITQKENKAVMAGGHFDIYTLR